MEAMAFIIVNKQPAGHDPPLVINFCQPLQLAILNYFSERLDETVNCYEILRHVQYEEIKYDFINTICPYLAEHFCNCPICEGIFHAYYLIRHEMAVYNDFMD